MQLLRKKSKEKNIVEKIAKTIANDILWCKEKDLTEYCDVTVNNITLKIEVDGEVMVNGKIKGIDAGLSHDATEELNGLIQKHVNIALKDFRKNQKEQLKSEIKGLKQKYA